MSVILKADVAFSECGVVLPLGKLGVGDLLVPFVAVHFVCGSFDTVSVVLDVLAFDHDTAFVPLANRLGLVAGGGFYRVVRAGLLGFGDGLTFACLLYTSDAADES